MSEPVLQVEGLNKLFRTRRSGVTHAVRDVGFELGAGRTLAVVGESGAGKSTVGRLVLRLIAADSGSVRLGGTDVMQLRGRDLRRARREMQMVFQDPFGSFDPRLGIGRSIAEPLRVNLGLNRADRERRVHELLEMVGLREDHAAARPSALSGGQLQRAAVARALSVEPRVIVCDEAVAALDVSVRAQILNLLLDLQDRTSVAYLFITHDFSTVRAIADDVLVLRHGAVVECGPAEDVFDSPEHPYTKELLAAVPVLARRR